jgi:hypothetical protein
MITIKLIFLGNIKNYINLKKIVKWKSKIIKIEAGSIINNLPEPNHKSIFLNQEFKDEQLKTIVGEDTNELRICIINYSLEDNFYVRRLGNKTAIISIRNINNILSNNNISIENFLLKTIYEIATLYIETENNFTINAYQIPHRETRKCLFDLNGDIIDILQNSEEPIICSECKSRLMSKTLPDNYLYFLEKEIKKIKKRLILKIELFIKKYPFFSLILTVLFTLILNIISNYLYDRFFK